MRIRCFLLILLLLFGGLNLCAQEDEPAWLVVARAGRLMAEGEFGLSIQSYRRALDLAPDNPEALLGLGRAYKAIGDLSVALEYFERALANRGEFVVPDEALMVRYERADVYRTRRDFAEYERELFAVIADDPLPDDALVPEDAPRLIGQQGLDRFLVLYRLPESGATKARSMLSELLVGLGRYRAAAGHASIAVLQSFTVLIEAVIDRDPTYEFSTVSDLMERAGRYPETTRYLAEHSRLYHDLYYLAAAYWGERDDTALAIWRTLSRIDRDGTWGGRARRQLENPRIEPLIVPTR